MQLILFFVFVILPILETIIFVLLGVYWGWIQALLLTAITSFFGFSLSKYYQFCAKGNLEKAIAGELPDGHIMDNMMLYLACFLLMLPGFITDFCGLVLLVPWGRKLVLWLVGRRLSAKFSSGLGANAAGFYFHNQSSSQNQNNYDADFTSSQKTPAHRDGSARNTTDDDIIDVDFEVKH